VAEANPFAAPASDAAPAHRHALEEDRVVTPEILEAMVQTRPWLLVVSVSGFVFAAIFVLAAVGTFAFGTFAAVRFGGTGLIAIIYVLCAAFSGLSSLWLWRYAASIKLMREGYGVHALVDALRHQRSFWRLVGVLTTVVVALNLVMFAIGVASAL
jgi:hypothetical protein